MHVLGIDAGGSKTVCLLADGEGRIVSEARGPGANLQTAGELGVEKVLHFVIEEAMGEREIRADAVCLGIAGVDRPADADVIRTIMRRLGFKTRTLVVNDALIALVAGAGDRAGVVVIAGTGSIAYGRDAAGRAARAGGWGYLLGDEGGGFWIGRAALSAVVRQFDGRGPATFLTELVLHDMALATPPELIHAIYEAGLPRHRIASIAAVVQRAASDGDVVAREILAAAASELVAAAQSVIARLGTGGDPLEIVLAGGIFRAIPILESGVTIQLSQLAPAPTVHRLVGEPALGAVHLALATARGQATLPTYI